MEKILTIQKRNNLNEVFRADEPGTGNAHHKYIIFRRVFPVGEPERYLQIATIQFQHGPRLEKESEYGLLDSDLLEIVRDRLTAFQYGEFATKENEMALIHIEEALMWLNKRAEDRAERGVLGKNQK